MGNRWSDTQRSSMHIAQQADLVVKQEAARWIRILQGLRYTQSEIAQMRGVSRQTIVSTLKAEKRKESGQGS